MHCSELVPGKLWARTNTREISQRIVSFVTRCNEDLGSETTIRILSTTEVKTKKGFSIGSTRPREKSEILFNWDWRASSHLLTGKLPVLSIGMFTDTTNSEQIGNSHWSDHESTRLFIPSLSLLFTYPIASSLTCIVRAYSTHVWFFVSPKRETKTLSSHRQTDRHMRVCIKHSGETRMRATRRG